MKHPVRFLEDGTELKYCGKCDEWKPKTLEFFYFRKARNCWEGPCRQCRSDRGKEEYATRSPEARNNWAASIKYRYGITEDEYWERFENQRGVCKICKRPQKDGRKLAVDHDHLTGEIRGLLCYKCNTAAGLIDDDPVLAEQLMLYLKGELQ